jgi:peptidoglycan/xylan/chitin deacetylase (PgdA/CDA1 family)
MNEAQKVLESITGIHSVLIRSPYGSVPYLVKPFRKALNAQSYQIWDWNMDSRDWELKKGKYVETVIVKSNNSKEMVRPHRLCCCMINPILRNFYRSYWFI